MTGHRFNPAKADRLLDPSRKKAIDTEWLMEQLSFSDQGNVADLGAGNGYFTLPLAEKTKGDVYAVDVEPEMLGMLAVRAEDKGIENIGYIEASIDEIPLPDECVEAVVVALVLHELPDRPKVLLEMKRLLKNGGRGAIIEWVPRESKVGPPIEERIPQADIEAEIKAAGLNIVKVEQAKNVYTIITEKPS